MFGLPRTDKLLCNLFYKYGLIVHKHKWLFIVFPVILSGILGCGFFFLNDNFMIRHEDLYWLKWSRAHSERMTFVKTFPLQDQHYFPGRAFNLSYMTDVLVQVKGDVEDRNILRKLPEVLAMSSELENFGFYPDFDNPDKQNYTYQELCVRSGPTTGCYTNARHINFFLDQSHIWKSMGEDTFSGIVAKNSIESAIHIYYPFSLMGGEPFNIAPMLGRVRYVQDNTSDCLCGVPYEAETIRMIFTVIQDGEEAKKSEVWQKLFEEKLSHWNENNPESNLTPAYYTSDSITDTLDEIGQLLPKYFILAVIISTTFAGLCCLMLQRNGPEGRLGIDVVRSKPLLALAGVTTAGLASLSGIGLLLMCGMSFNHTVGVMPYLAIAIGIDDMFILTSAFHRTDRKARVEQRIAETMSHAVVSITITSLTDALSFGVGCSSRLEFVVQFCAYCSAGVAFNYLYQITFFAGFLVLSAEHEAEGRNAFFPCLESKPAVAKINEAELDKGKRNGRIQIAPLSKGLENPAQVKKIRKSSETTDTDGFTSSILRKYYGAFVTNGLTQISIVLLYIAYIATAIYGCTQLDEGMDYAAVGSRDNHISKYADFIQGFWKEGGTRMHMLVNNVPDLSQREERVKLNDTIDAFLNTDYTQSRAYLENWLDVFERRLTALDQKNATYDFGIELCQWLDTNGGEEYWRMDIVFEGGQCWAGYRNASQIQAIRLFLPLKNFDSSANQSKAINTVRDTADSFPEYNITVFQRNSPWTDWYVWILPSTMQNLGLAVLCMIIVSLILIPSVTCAILITLSVVSIDLGVFGFMSLWSIKLDCISSICLLMSVGFSVDLSAHISYAFISSEGSPRERIIDAIGTLGTPILQGATSTVLGTLALLFMDAIMVDTFCKMIFLVMSFAVLHSLAFLPVVLMRIVPVFSLRMKKEVKDAPTSNGVSGAESGISQENGKKKVQELSRTEVTLQAPMDNKTQLHS